MLKKAAFLQINGCKNTAFLCKKSYFFTKYIFVKIYFCKKEVFLEPVNL